MAPRLFVLALVVAVALLAVPAVRHLREQPPPPPPILRLTLGAPAGTELGSGDESLDAAISPDERQIAFVATRSGTTLLWRRALESDRAEIVPGTEGARMPSWSPDGASVAFFADGRLKRVQVTSGGAVMDLADAPSPAGILWLPDSSVLFAPQTSGVIRRLRDGTVSDATSLRTGERAHVLPSSAGAAGDFVYTAVADNGRRTVRLVRGSEERDLTATSGHGQIAGSVLLYVRDGVLFAQRMDDGVAQGRALPIANGLGVTSSGRALFTASPRVLLTAASSPRARELAWFDVAGARTGTSGETGDYWQVRLSPDDRHAAVTLTAPLLRTLDIAVISVATVTDAEPLTRALAADSDPVWAPDGRSILFRSLQGGRPELFTKRVHDANAEENRLGEMTGDATPTDWRGPTVTMHALDAASGYDIWTIDPSRPDRTPVVKSGFNDTDGRWSPDGEWLAYVSDEPGHPDIYARRRDGARVRVSFSGGTRPRWSRDGSSLFFLRGFSIMRGALQDTSPPRFAQAVQIIELPDVRDFDVTHRRDALLAIVPVEASAPAPVSAIVDWQSALPPVP